MLEGNVLNGTLKTIREDRVRGLTLISMLVFSGSMACAQQRPCTDAEAQRAETETDTLRSWDSLYRSWTQYRQCDDGSIAEGYSECVARILVDHWGTLSRSATLGRKDARFRHFVLGHVDATLNNDDLKKIRINANTKCPPKLGAICADLVKEADSSLKYLESLGIK